jgi:hypothetical protein
MHREKSLPSNPPIVRAFSADDRAFLRDVCPAEEFERNCEAALLVVAHQHALDRERGQSTKDRKERIERRERQLSALNLLLADRWLEEDNRALSRILQFVVGELGDARRAPTRGHHNALDVGAVIVVQAFAKRGLPLTTSKHRASAVRVLRLICERAGLFVGIKSHQAAIRKAQR